MNVQQTGTSFLRVVMVVGFTATVKPVLRGHLWDKENVTI